MLEIVGANRMRIQVDTSEIDDPRELRRIPYDDLFRRPTRREPQLHGFDPFRSSSRRALLEEEVAFDAVDVPLHRHRPAGHTAHRPVTDGDVVVDEIELRVPRARKEDLVWIRDRDLVSCEFENHFLRCHLFTICIKSGMDGCGGGETTLETVDGGRAKCSSCRRS